MKILVVDDQAANRGLLSFLLEDGGHDVVEASSGEQGVEVFNSSLPDLILMDVMMPGMDGYEAAAEIKSRTENYVPIIFLTGLSDDTSLSKCIESGGDDFLTKPVNEVLLNAKIKAHERIRDLNNELTRKNEELERYQSVLRQEHELAEYVFESAISWQQDAPCVKKYLSPMGGFSGDLILTASTERQSHLVMLGDFTGHGLPAALGALPVSQDFQAFSEQNVSLKELVRQLNKTLYDYLPAHMFCAANIIELNREGTHATCWLGGLPDMFLVGGDGKIKSAFPSEHMALGVLSDASFNDGIVDIELQPNDRLFTYSDGVTDCCDKNGNMLGEDRFEQMFDGAVAGDALFESLVDRITRFGEGRPQDDDISMLELSAGPCESRTNH